MSSNNSLEAQSARIIRSTGAWYEIMDSNQNQYSARLRGKFRQDSKEITNPIAVGDEVLFERNEDGTAQIIEIIDRKNFLPRKATHGRRGHQILISNIDYALVVVSITQPQYKTGFIDRFLVSCEAYGIEPIIILNKWDLSEDITTDEIIYHSNHYKKLGYKVFHTSILKPESLEPLVNLITNKVSVFIGPSGVGKTSLLNHIDPSLEEKTSEISGYSNKGKHTTTFAKLLPLPFGGYLADTPGIREFGLYNIEDWELSLYFPEMIEGRTHCKFSTCTHIHEPSCGVIELVDTGLIEPFRYLSYMNIIESLNDR